MNSARNTNTEVASAITKFNAFDILVPEKLNTLDKNECTGLLVDVSDNTNNTVNLLDIPQELQGSFVDEKKVEYDLLDLFQNIYVTPQQVKCKVSQIDNVSEAPKIDFTDFFEKLESGQKIDWTKCDENDNKVGDSSHLEKSFEKSPNQSKIFDNHNIDNFPYLNGTRPQLIFEEIIDRSVSSQTLKLSERKLVSKIELENDKLDQISDNDIDEVLPPNPPLFFTKNSLGNIDRTILSNVSKEFNVPFNNQIGNVTDDKKLRSNTEVKSQTLLIGNDKESLPPVKNLSQRTTSNFSGIYPTESDLAYNQVSSIGAANNVTKHSTGAIFAINKKNVTAQCNSGVTSPEPFSQNRYKNVIQSSIIDLNAPQCWSIDQKNSIPMLQTVKKDKKSCIIKKDSEKIGVTKGPCIVEKSIELPKIMQRLAERKKALDEHNYFKRKIKLDSSVRHNSTKLSELPVPDVCNTHIKISPEILMKDCNKERLKALKIRTEFETFVKTGKFAQ